MIVERTTRSVTMTTGGVTYHERALRLFADLKILSHALISVSVCA